jgi:CRISPR-associated protein Cmr2
VAECSRRVAGLLLDPPPDLGVTAALIVPSEQRVQEIGDQLQREGSESLAYGGRVTNHLEARVEALSCETVESLAAACENEARSWLAKQLQASLKAAKAKRAIAGVLGDVVEEELYEAQVKAIEHGDFLEFFAAWSLVERGLHEALARAWKLLDGRKAARLFGAPSWSRAGRRKCDLDAGRDSVLWTANTRDRHQERLTGTMAARRHLARKRLGIGPEEELDALGLARRLAVFLQGPDLGKLPFPPISRVAIDPWLRRAAEDPDARGVLGEIRDFLDRREVKDHPLFFDWCSPARDPETKRGVAASSQEELFPFDASFLFEGGTDALLKALDLLRRRGADEAILAGAEAHLRHLRPKVATLHRLVSLPVPYYALLAMDGDGVGAALLAEESLQRKQELVGALDRFADGAEETFREMHGCAFYLGGDDLAGYLPLDGTLPAVEELADRFAAVQGAFGNEAEVSLSGGLVLAHVKADLRAIRARAQRALSEAKKARRRWREAQGGLGGAEGAAGWLTVVELPRSGMARTAVGPLRKLAANLAEWATLLARGDLSLRSAFLLSDLVARYSKERVPEGGRIGLELARYRLLAQARRSTKDAARRSEGRLHNRLREVEQRGWREASHLAAELAIASRLRKVPSQPRDEGQR